KEGREPPQRETFYAAHAEEHSDKKKKEKDNGAYPYAMCAPFVGYAYGPYPLGGVGYAGGDPGYGETGTGVSGGCCQGTCGGMVGAGGSCAGVGGSCGGAACASAGPGAGVSGSCAGAGGCGGGGGGCGGGGGGGGGGCGGGGGGGGC
ncbi:hypothetical protein SLS62_011441, partial [Diatrype stigma]